MAEVHKYIELDEFDLIIFECNGLLVDWRKGITQTIKRILEKKPDIPQRKRLPEKYYVELLGRTWPSTSFADTSRRIIKDLGEKYGIHLEEDELNALVQSIADWELFPDVLQCFEALKNRTMKIALSAPGFDEELFEPIKKKFDDLGIQFDHYITYDKTTGWHSTKKTFLTKFLEQNDISKDKVLYVGGNFVYDVREARWADLNTVLISRPGYGKDHPADTEIYSWEKPDLHLPDLEEFANWPLRWYRTLTHIPGTKPFDYKVDRAVKSKQAYALRKYGDLTSISDEKKKELEGVLLKELQPILRFRARNGEIRDDDAALWFILFGGLVGYILGVVIPYAFSSAEKLPTTTNAWQLVLTLPFYILTLIFILLVVVLPIGLRFPDASPKYSFLWLVFLVGTFFYGVYRFARSSSIMYLDEIFFTVLFWATIVFTFVILFYSVVIERKSKERDWLRLVAVAGFALYAFLMVFLKEEGVVLGHVALAIFASVVGYLTVAALVLIYALVVAIPIRLKERRFTKTHPTGVIIQELMDILGQVEAEGTDWGSSTTARGILPKLEKIVVAFQSLAGQIRTGDVDTDFWYRQTMNQKADGIRDLKKWVLTPQPQTRADFQQRISSTFVQVLERNWDALAVPAKRPADEAGGEEKKAAQLQRRRSFAFLVWQTTQKIIAGLLPLLVVFLLRYLTTVPEPLASYMTVFAFVWAVLAIISIFDASAVEDFLGPVMQLAEKIPKK